MSKPTINDVAAAAGVSKKTVSRVINESPFVKEETRKAVLEIIRDTGYAPDPQARGLAFRRSFLVGLIYDNPNPQHTVSHQQGILEALKGSGFELVVRPMLAWAATNLSRSRAMSSVRRALVLLVSMGLMVAGGRFGCNRERIRGLNHRVDDAAMRASWRHFLLEEKA